jgi:Lon-like ATP-dependent protease
VNSKHGHEGAPKQQSSSSSSSGSDSDNSDSPQPPPSPPPESPPPASGSIAKQSVPEVYPQVLALPISRRPLFPGFYKAVVIRNPAVVAAIREMMKRGQPYLGAFLLKEDADSDVITDINSVYPVGVFAQITSVFSATGKDDDKEDGLTAVLYPHRRIKIAQLLKAGESSVLAVENINQDTPSQEQLETPPPSPDTPHQDLVKSSPCKLLLNSSSNLS